MRQSIQLNNPEEMSKAVETQSSQGRVNPQSKEFIRSVMINVVMLSFMMGYTMVYFNAIKFEDLMVIFDLKFDKAFAQGFFTSCIPASACIGALMSKILIEKFTRKHCFDLMNAMCIIGVLLIQTKYVPLLIIGRLLQGALIGVGTAIVPLYIKQFIPQMNGQYGLYHQLLFTFGIVCAFSFNLVLHSIFDESQTYWRCHFVVPLIISLYQMYMVHFYYNYETPRYLVSIDQFEQAKQILKKIYKPEFIEEEFHILYEAVHSKTFQKQKQELDDEIQMSEIRKNSHDLQVNSIHDTKSKDTNESSLKETFLKKSHKKPVNNPLAVFCTLHLAFQQQMIGIGAVIVYSGDIIKQIVPSLFYYYAVIIHTLGLICVMIGLHLIHKFGRVVLMQVGASVIACCLLLTGVNFLMGENRIDWVIIVAVLALRGAFSCTLGPLAWLYMAEIVKPNIIPYGTFINWAGATLVMFSFPVMSQWLGGPGWIFIINAVLCIFTIVINGFTLVQTKDKHELTIRHGFDEEVQTLRKYKVFQKCFD